jgi:hypothetical protein
MGDGSSRGIVSALKNEWALLWEAFSGENEEANTKSNDAFCTGKLEVLTVAQVREITKSLSEGRKKLNQKLEILNKEIDLNTAKLESLELVGGDKESTLNRINELTDIGQNLTTALVKLDEKLRLAREQEDEVGAEA